MIGNGAFPRLLAAGRRRLVLPVAGYTVFCRLRSLLVCSLALVTAGREHTHTHAFQTRPIFAAVITATLVHLFGDLQAVSKLQDVFLGNLTILLHFLFSVPLTFDSWFSAFSAICAELVNMSRPTHILTIWTLPVRLNLAIPQVQSFHLLRDVIPWNSQFQHCWAHR